MNKIRNTTVFCSVVFLAVAGVATPASAQFTCSTEVRFHFIGLHRDDGTKGPGFDPSGLTVFVDKANQVFGPAGLRFVYRQSLDWEEMNSTLLWHGLRSYNGGDPDQVQAASMAQNIANARPGKIVVFFREDFAGDYAAPRLLGAIPPDTGWQEGLDYISYWGFSDHPNPNLSAEAGVFAHELGHYLGLYHTHPSHGGMTDASARARLEITRSSCTSDANCTVPGTRCVAGLCRDTMVGDPNVADSPEDPSPGAWLNGCPATPACPQAKRPFPDCSCAPFSAVGSSTITTSIPCSSGSQCGATGVGQTSACVSNMCTYTYTPSLTNVMSYYGGGSTTAAGQLARIQSSIASVPSRNLLCNIPCWPNFHNLPLSSADMCLSYWKYREGYGPHAISVDWSGSMVAGTLRNNSNGWYKTASRSDYENNSYFWPWFGVASSHYNWRPTVPVALGISRNLAGSSSIQTFHRLDWNSFVTQWNQQFSAGRALVDVSVTNSNPLELSAVWAYQGGNTSATYWLGTVADVKNFSNNFYGSRVRLDRVVPIGNGAGHTLLANWNSSTALRGIWSSANSQYQSLFNSLGGLGYSLHDLEYFEDRGLVSVWEAPHNECTGGGRLHPDTDVCTKTICETHSPWADPYCCDYAWDSQCLAEVTSWCSRTCPP